jgi:hypothetical protein
MAFPTPPKAHLWTHYSKQKWAHLSLPAHVLDLEATGFFTSVKRRQGSLFGGDCKD